MMLTLICSAILCFIVAFVIVHRDNPNETFKEKLKLGLIFGLLFPGAIFWMSIGFVISAFIGQFNHESVFYSRAPIVSLHNTTTSDGRFVLGTGSVKDTEYYFLFAQNQSNDYYRMRVPVFSSIIRESDSEPPSIKTSVRRLSDNAKWWGIISPKENFIIIVPEGTIIQDFSVR